MRQAIPAGLALLIFACGNVISPDAGDRSQDDADVTEPDMPVPPTCVWTDLDATPFDNLNGVDDETSATLTSDGLQVFFTRSLGDRAPEIHEAVRKTPEGQFAGSQLVTELSSEVEEEFDVEISAKGEEIFFTRLTSRDDSPAIWTAARSSSGPFGTAAPIADLKGHSPTISPDGLTLYFIDLNTYIMRSKREGMAQAWGLPMQVGERDSGYTSIDISTDGLHLLMSGALSDGQPEVAIASRNSIEQSFGEPVAIAGGFARPEGAIALRGGGAWVAGDRQIVMNVEIKGRRIDLYISTCVGD